MKTVEKFNLDFRGILSFSKVILPLLNDEEAPPFTRISNLKYFVVPEAVKFTDGFRFIIGYRKPTNPIITLKDFNIYKVTEYEGNNCLHIHHGVRQALGFEIIFNYGKKSQKVAMFLRDEDEVMFSDYQLLTDTLPYNIESEKDSTWFNVSIASHWIASRSIAILTLLYTLYNLKEDMRIEGGQGQDQKALEYVKRLTGRIKEVGNNFFEALDSLRVFGAFAL
jgi:hypothetical protein